MAGPIGVDVVAVHAAYAAATRAGDAEALTALMEPDAVVWHNYDDAEIGPEASLRTLRWLHRTLDDLRWTDVAMLPTAEGFVWRAVISGSSPTGTVRAHTCMVVTLSPAGRVERVDEYLDPAAFAAAAT